MSRSWGVYGSNATVTDSLARTGRAEAALEAGPSPTCGVSTAQQDVRSQRLAILEYARKHDFRIDDFIEATASGQASEKRRRLDELTSVLQRGDRLVVSELSRLGRSLGQVVAILDALAKAGVAFVALKEHIRVEGKHDIQTKVMTTLFALFAEVERDLISERTREGLARTSVVSYTKQPLTAVAERLPSTTHRLENLRSRFRPHERLRVLIVPVQVEPQLVVELAFVPVPPEQITTDAGAAGSCSTFPRRAEDTVDGEDDPCRRAAGSQHGYGIAHHLKTVSEDVLQVGESSGPLFLPFPSPDNGRAPSAIRNSRTTTRGTGSSSWSWEATPVERTCPPQAGQPGGSGASWRTSTRVGLRRRAGWPYWAPARRPGRLGLQVRALAKGAAWRYPARLAASSCRLRRVFCFSSRSIRRCSRWRSRSPSSSSRFTRACSSCAGRGASCSLRVGRIHGLSAHVHFCAPGRQHPVLRRLASRFRQSAARTEPTR